MTVKELIEQLKTVDENLEIVVQVEDYNGWSEMFYREPFPDPYIYKNKVYI